MGRLLAILLIFAVLAHGAQDLWAATVVYAMVLLITVIFLFIQSEPGQPGLSFQGLLTSLLVLVAFYYSYRTSIRPEESYLELTDWTFSLLLMLVAVDVFRSDSALTSFLRLVPMVFLVQAPLEIYQRIKWPPIESQGTMLNANFNAAFHLLWIPVVIHFWRQHRQSGRLPIYWSLIMGAMAINLLLGGSASVVLLLMAASPYLLYEKRTLEVLQKHKRVAWAATLLAVLIMGSVLWYKLSVLYRWTYVGPYMKPTSRITWWASGIQMFKENFWRGLGPGCYGSAYLAYKIGTGQNTLYAHSFPVTLLAETGLLGFISVLVLFGSWAFRFGRAAFGDEKRSPFLVGLMLMTAFSLFNINFELLSNLMAFTLGMAIVASAKPARSWSVRKSVSLVGTGLAVWALINLLPPFLSSQAWVSGDEYLKEGKIKEAEQAYLSAKELDARPSAPYQRMAQIRSHEKRFIEAAVEQRGAIHRDRYNAQLWHELGIYLEGAGDLEGATQAARRAFLLNHTNAEFQANVERLQKAL